MRVLLTVAEEAIAAIDHFSFTILTQNTEVLVLVLGGLSTVPGDSVLELWLET